MLQFRFGQATFTCSNRTGGTSLGAYASANIGDHVGDDPLIVAENRAALAQACGVARIAFAEQVHGNSVVHVNELPAQPPAADAFVLSKSGIGVAMMTADCMPIGIATEGGARLAVIHAGWRGVLAGVIESTVAVLRELPGAGPPDRWDALIGPCARATTYEFGEADLDELAQHFGPQVRSTTRWGTPSADLVRAANIILERVGVRRVADCAINTMDDDNYFSYRRSGLTGRQALVGVLGAPDVSANAEE